jgi:hypothetical protein
MARKSNHFNATQQARFYRLHAERLQKLLHECDDSRDEENYYSEEFKTLNEEMAEGAKARSFTSTKLKQPATETPAKPENRRSVHFSEPTPSQDNIFNNPNPFRKKTNPHSAFPSTKTCDEQSQPNTNIVTHAQVHTPNTSRTTDTPPNMSTSPKSRIDVTDNPPPTPTLILTDEITVESTDT